MKTIFTIMFVFCLTTAVFGQKTTQDTAKMSKADASASALMEKERMMWQHIKDKKYDDFAKNIADDYQGVYNYGVQNKAAEVDGVKKFALKNFTTSDIKVSFPDKDLAIVTSKIMVEGENAGATETMNMQTASVWIKRNGNWYVIMHTDTPIKQ